MNIARSRAYLPRYTRCSAPADVWRSKPAWPARCLTCTIRRSGRTTRGSVFSSLPRSADASWSRAVSRSARGTTRPRKPSRRHTPAWPRGRKRPQQAMVHRHSASGSLSPPTSTCARPICCGILPKVVWRRSWQSSSGRCRRATRAKTGEGAPHGPQTGWPSQAEPRTAPDGFQRPLPPRCGSQLRGRGHRAPPGALRRDVSRHQRLSSASQWLTHVPLALLRRSITTPWRCLHRPGRQRSQQGLVVRIAALADGSEAGPQRMGVALYRQRQRAYTQQA